MAIDAEPVNPWQHLASFHMQRAARAMLLILTARLEAFDLRPSEATVLCIVDRNPGISQAAIARMIATRRPNISPITRLLEQRELVERGKAGDSKLGWSTTEAGRQTSARINRIVAEHEKQLHRAVPPDLRGSFDAALQACGAHFLGVLNGLDPARLSAPLD